jgi:hypothetical protein
LTRSSASLPSPIVTMGLSFLLNELFHCVSCWTVVFDDQHRSHGNEHEYLGF